jgi:hypothetical protein
MEALTAASVAALTLYDMCKAVDRGMVIEQVRLLEKLGGDSLAEQLPRFEQLRKAERSGLHLTGQPHVFWS